MDFSDQVAIVTGSSSGIGAAAAIGMALRPLLLVEASPAG